MTWHLDTRILRMLVAVAETPTAVKAALRLNLTPSALSHQMKTAEANLRVRLFDRRGPRLQLTTAGQQLYAAAQPILAQLAAAEDVLERSRRGQRPVVRVGGGAYPVERLLAAHLDAGELAQIDLVTRTRAFPPVQAVAEGELDLALVSARIARPGIVARPVLADPLVAVVPAAHPLAAAPSLAEGAFEEATYVSYSRIVEEGLEDDLLFRPTRRAPARFVLAETVGAILDLVAAGVGFSILSRWAVPAGHAGIAVLPLTAGGAVVTWSLVHREAERDAATLALAARIAAALGTGAPPPA